MARPIGATKDDWGATVHFDDGSSRYLYGQDAQSFADSLPPPPQQPSTLYAPEAPSSMPAPQGMMAANEPNMSVAPDQSQMPPQAPPVATDAAPPPPPQQSGPDLSYGPAGNRAALHAYQEARRGRAVYTPAYDPQKDDASRSAVRDSTTTQVAGAVPHSQFVQEAPARLYAAEKDALDQRYLIERRRAELENDLAAEQMRLANERQAMEIQRQREIDARISESRAQYQAYQEDLERGKIDPDRAVGKNRFSSAIAVALGEIGRAMTGGQRNVALDIINARIDRDVEAQKLEWSRKRERANNAYADFMKLYGDRDVARAAVASAQSQYALAKFKEQGAALGYSEANANYAAGLAQLEQAAAERQAKLEREMAGQITTQVNSRYAAPRAASVSYVGGKSAAEAARDAKTVGEFVGTVSGAGTPEQRFEMAKEGAKLERENDARVIVENGQPVGFAVGKDHKEVQEGLDTSNTSIATITRMRKTMENNPGLRFAPNSVPGLGTVGTSFDADATSLLLAIKRMESLGALDKGSVEVAERLIPNSKTVNAETQLTRLEAMFEKGRRNLLQNHVTRSKAGFVPGVAPDKPTVRGDKDL